MIRVLFFASLKETVGMAEWSCPLPLAASSIGFEDLLAMLRAQIDASAYAALRAQNVRVALNQGFIDPASSPQLAAGDEVAFLPPVTGG